MINKNYIHLLNYFASKNLLTGESKLAFKHGRGFEFRSTREETKTKIKNKEKLMKDKLKGLNEYEDGFEKFIKQDISIKITKGLKLNQFIAKFHNKLSRGLSKKERNSKAFNNFMKNVFADIGYIIKSNKAAIFDNVPCEMTLSNDGKLKFHHKGKSIFPKKEHFDVKRESRQLAIYNHLKKELQNLRDRIGKRKEAVVKRTVTKKVVLTKTVKKMIKEEPAKAINKLIAKNDYLVEKGKGYEVRFLTPKGRVDRIAEKNIKIHDLFDLSKLKGGNINISFTVSGVSPGGRKFKHEAVYHKGAGTFYIKNTATRVRIYDKTIISNIKYEAGDYVSEEEKKKRVLKSKSTKKLNAAQKLKTQTKVKAKAQERFEENERKRDAQDSLIDDYYYGLIFKNAQYNMPERLRNDEHFKNVNIWKKISRYLGPILEDPPFKLMSPSQKRHYIQEIIQKNLNSRLYAEDFFDISLDGKRELYKGGYKQFITDYYRVEKKMINNDIDEDYPEGRMEKKVAEEWKQLRIIALGIARVFDALEQFRGPEAFKVKRETKADVYRPMLAGVETIEKEPAGTKYHNLGSLLHKKENAPESTNIGVTNLMLAKIKEQFYKNEIEGFNTGPLLQSKGGLKLLFMAFGLRKLLAEKCLKKVNDNNFILVKLPKYGWMEALATIQQTKAKLWDHSNNDFKKWEKVRASLSQGMKARLFIRSIFTPTGSVVKENFNWWQGMWHGRLSKDKRITMAHLGEITINPSHFEKFMAQDRGYNDMIEKTSNIVPGTTVYQPNPTDVLNKTNDYIEYGLTSILMNAPTKSLGKVISKLVKELGIEKSLGMDIKSLVALDRDKILDVLYKALKLNNIEPSQLKGKKALLKLIRVGFILGRRIETSKKWAEVMNKNLSTRPVERKAQLEALKNGCPIYLLKAIEQKVHLAIVAITNGEIPANAKTQRFGAGMTASIKLFEINGEPQYFTVGIFGQQGKTLQEQCIPFVGVSGAIKAGKKLKFRYAVGATTTFAGAAVGLEVPIGKSDYNFYFTASAGFDYKGKTGGVGGSIGGRWGRERSEKRQVKESMALRNLKKIDKEIDNKNEDKAATLILNHPTFGKLMTRIKTKAKIDNATIVDIYLSAKGDWINYAKRNMKVPWLLGIGIGAFVGIDLKSKRIASAGGGAYITFKIPGTEVNYVIRHSHPKYSDYMQRKAVAVELRQKLRKEGMKNFKIAPYVIKAKSGIIYFDSNLGRTGIGRRISEKSANIADGKYQRGSNKKGPKKKGQINTFQSTFELAKKTFSKLNIHVEKVKDPRNPKGFMLALTPLQTKGSNVEVLMDPAMKARGLILDKANNRFLVSANIAKDLYVTRSTYRYPFQRRGAMNLHVIAFKANPDLDNGTLRNSSPWSIYKFKGEKYQRVKNEALGKQHYDANIVNGRPVMTKRPSNVMTLAEFKNSKRKHESFIDFKADYTRPQAQEWTGDLHKAMGYKEIEPIRAKKLKLQKFGDWIYADKNFSKKFDTEIGKIKTPDGENRLKTKWFKRMALRYKAFATKEGLPANNINEQEKNLIYAYLLDKSFSRLIRKKNPNPKIITRRLEIRNGLFKKYMKKFIQGFKTNNGKQFREIMKKHPGATIEGIVNYLLLCMPQNFEQYKKFMGSKRNLPLTAGIKYGSYTHRRSGQAMPTGFGVDFGPDAKGFKETLMMIKPTRLNVNSPNSDERASANLILRMMSPLPTENLDRLNVKKKFLESELSQLVFSMYDDNNVSPLLSILGIQKFKGLTKIVQNLNGKNLATMLKTHKAAFEDFKTIVLGIREAQLNGSSTYTFDNKYIFHVAETKIYAGPYLKCGNGTVAVHQQIGITLKGVKRGRIFGANADVNVGVNVTEKKSYRQFTAGAYTGHKFKKRKTPTPPRHDKPKDITPTRSTAPQANQPAPTSGNPTETGGTDTGF